MRMILGGGLGLTALGAILGAGGALALSRLVTSQLYGVKPYDPATFLVVGVVLAAVSLVAACIPAIRAIRIDPLTALRYE